MYSIKKPIYIRGIAMFILISMCIPTIVIICHVRAPQSVTQHIKRVIAAEKDSIIVEFVPRLDTIPQAPIIEDTVEVLSEPEVIAEPEIIILSEFSDEDISLIARVTMSESSTQSFETQVAVAQTIINRMRDGTFGDSISDIIYEPHQYSTADNGPPSEQIYSAVQEAINTSPYPDTMFYFRQYYYHGWATDYRQIDDLYFSLS